MTLGVEMLRRTLQPLLAQVPEPHRPLLLALAERMAAGRYRVWAELPPHSHRRDGFVECARREEDIATRIESLFPDAAHIQDRLRDELPEFEDVNAAAFDGLSLTEQLTLQAEGERLGAATWRTMAATVDDGKTRSLLLSCAGLEDKNAEFLERMLQA